MKESLLHQVFPSNVINHPLWNIFFMAFANAMTMTSSTLLTTIGPLAIVSLGGNDSFAALTIGIFMIGSALSSVPSAQLFSGGGRLFGFGIGCLCQVIGGIIGSIAMVSGQVSLVLIACSVVGLGQGLGQFYRFSAVEVSPPDYKTRAVTYVLAGGVLAAFLGPICASYPADLFTQATYIGSFAAMSLVGVVNFIVILFVQFPEKDQGNWWKKRREEREKKHQEKSGESLTAKLLDFDESSSSASDSQGSPTDSSSSSSHQDTSRDKTTATTSTTPTSPTTTSTPPFRRRTWQIITQPLFILSCAVSTLAHTIMAILMSNAAVSMKAQNFSLTTISFIMELHFCGMFAPGFFTGSLISQLGSFLVALIGGLIFLVSCVVFVLGTNEWNYFLGMVLLGVGWNFSFSAGTVMVTSSHLPSEATKAQAVNVFVLSFVSGTFSSISGFVSSAFGWRNLVFAIMGIVLLNLLMFVKAWDLKQNLDKDGADNLAWTPAPTLTNTTNSSSSSSDSSNTVSGVDMDVESPHNNKSRSPSRSPSRSLSMTQPSSSSSSSSSSFVPPRSKVSFSEAATQWVLGNDASLNTLSHTHNHTHTNTNTNHHPHPNPNHNQKREGPSYDFQGMKEGDELVPEEGMEGGVSTEEMALLRTLSM